MRSQVKLLVAVGFGVVLILIVTESTRRILRVVPEKKAVSSQVSGQINAAPKRRLSSRARLSLSEGEWQRRAEGILYGDLDDLQKGHALAQVLPHLPEDEQTSVTGEFALSLEDDSFAGAAGPMLFNARTGGAVMNALMADTLSRPNTVKLPLLLEVARTPGHPKAADATSLLELYLDGDFGRDWKKWEAALEKELRKNPD